MKERGDDSGSSHEIIQTILNVCLKLCLGSWGLFCAGITLDHFLFVPCLFLLSVCLAVAAKYVMMKKSHGFTSYI